MWRTGEIIDGRYEVVELAGRGEMGEVYQVRHRQWNMDLAAKIPRADAWLSPQELRQFAAEAQTWVSLGLHPNICSCHFVRQIDGVPVVFAEYVPDGSLHHWIADRRIYKGSDAALRILDVAIQLAWGLGYAHQRHLVHQDVKPENVMIDLSGDDFAVKVTDFGLARARSGRRLLVAGSDIDVVSTGGLTPPYASPEQTDCRPLTHRTDVYSYAVSLLEILLTERRWAKGTDAPRYLAKYRARESVSPAPRMPAELTELLGRCLDEDPDERPSSMAEIGDELKEIYRAMSGTNYRREMPDAANLMADELNNRALSMLDLGEDAESDSLFAEALTADPRNLAATYNSGLVRWRRGAITDTDLLAEIEALRADSDDPQQVGSLIGQVHEERGVMSLEGTQAADSEWPVLWPAFQGMETVRRRHDPQGAEVARDVAMSMPQNPRDPHRLNPHDDAALALTPDGRLVLSGTWDGKIRLWDVRAGRCLMTLDGHHEEIQAVDLTPDGRFALSADEAGVICFWDLTRSSKTPRLTLTDLARTGMHLAQISLSSGGGIAFWASAQGRICMLDTSNGKKGFTQQRHGAQARAVRVSPRTRWLLSSGWETDDFRDRDDTVRVWDLRSGDCRHVLRGHSSWVTATAFRADERFAVTGSHDRTIRIWDLADGTCVHTLRGHTPDALALSDDGRHLLSGDAFDGTVRFWDVETGRCARTFPGHKNGTVAVHVEPDGHTGLSIGHDRTVRRWSLPAGHDAPFQVSRPRSPSQMNLLDARVRALTGDAEQAMADGRYSSALDLLTRARAIPGRGRHPLVVRAWRALESHCTRTRLREAWSTRTMAGHAGGVDTVDISPAGRIAVSGGDDGSIRVWELDTGACSRILDGHTGRVESVCLHPDADRLLSSSRDGTIRLWDMGTGECLRVLESGGRGTDTARARFAADGQQAVVADPSGDLRLWDLKTGDLVRSMRTSTGHSLSVAADGRLAAYARGDRAELWDLQRGARVRSLGSEFLHSIHAVCISANGGLAITAETEGIRLWDTALGNVLRTFSDDDPLADGPDRNTMIAITADGRYAVSAGYSSCAVLWDLATGHRMRELDGFERGMTCLAITPDGTRLVSGTRSGTLRLWELDWELDASQPPSDSPAAPAWTWDPSEDEVPADEPADEGRVLLIGFRPEQGQLIVARNNPDLARYVVVVIPGAGASPERLSELTERAEFLHHQLTGLTRERMSVVTWMDYQAPATARDARHAAPAAEGAIQLTEFIAGLRVTSQLGDQARITVIAHGYGGLVAGLAARDHSLDIDALVFLSCASAGVASASDLHVTGTVYATSPDLFGDGTPDDVHGPRPDSLAFGATVLRPTPLRYGDDPMVPYLPSVAEIILGLGLASGAGASAR
jgi:WD40 repeat protein/serine/threonine protein kinase/predicted alpha/beta-hydrolase family hydrolase